VVYKEKHYSHGHQIRRVGGFALLPHMGPVKRMMVENRSLSGTNWQRCVHILPSPSVAPTLQLPHATLAVRVKLLEMT
ncbi:hypothetical protein J6590_015845, partial [Homalodisca vitripennis]